MPSRKQRRLGSPSGEVPDLLGAERGAAARWRWALGFAAAGAMALGVQVYLLREFWVCLQGDEASVGIGLAAWFAGIVVGALVSRYVLADRARAVAAVSLGLLAISGGWGLVAARLSRLWLGIPAGEYLTLAPALQSAIAVFLLPGMSVGGGFVALATCSAQSGSAPQRAIGQLYVAEALGWLVGGLTVSLVLIPTLSPVTGLGLLLALGLAATAPLASAGKIAGRWTLPALAVVLAAVAAPVCSTPLEAVTERARFAGLVEGLPLVAWKYTPYEHLALGGDETRVLYASGQYVTSFPDPVDDELHAHQWMLLADRPQRVLNFGGIETGSLRFILRHPVHRVDLVVPDRRRLELVAQYLGRADQEALSDPRVSVHFQDPRRFLVRSRARYDLILDLAPDPTTLLLVRTRTVQFDQLVKDRLAPGGVYVSRFLAGPNAQAGETGKVGASLYRSLKEVFPVVRVTPGPDALFVAGRSSDSVTLDPATLAARYASRHISSEVFVPQLLPLLWPPERVNDLRRDLAEAAPSVGSTTDDHPVALLHALTLRQQVAQSRWAPVLEWVGRHAPVVVVCALLPGMLIALWQVGRRRRPATVSSALHATVVTGISGMVWSLVLFVSFQTRVGLLYSEIGILTAAFMLGAAVGGALAVRRLHLLETQFIAVAVSVLLTVFLISVGSVDSPEALTVLHGLMLVLCGVATGGVFPATARSVLASGAATPRTAGLVEAADHAGAGLAALSASVLLIPVFGLTASAVLVLALQLVALVTSLLGGHRWRP